MITTETIWTAGTLAREVGVSVETIRRLCGRGILHPVRDPTGRRLFTDADLATMRRRQAASESAHPDA